MRNPPGKKIIILGTSMATKGGIATVLRTYFETGLFARWPILHLATHRDGSGFAKAWVFLLAYGRFLLLLAGGKIALIHVHTASRASFWRKSLFILPASCLKIPIVIHLHGAEFKEFYELESGTFKQALVRWIFRKADRIVVLSSQWQRWLAGVVEAGRIVCIFNPAPVTIGSGGPLPSRHPNELLFLGRLSTRKGIYDLLAAVAELRKDFSTLQLTCCGDGDLQAVAARAARIGIADAVKIFGWVEGEQKRRLLMESTIYVLPSYNEGLPMGVLEAMAAGMPVVSTTVGGIPDAIENGTDGFLVAPGDVTALAGTLGQLLGDAELRRRIGEAARKKIRELFLAEKVVAQVEQLYRELGGREKPLR
jgi:glycosyltransferase involved in cell wall biosynthesis